MTRQPDQIRAEIRAGYEDDGSDRSTIRLHAERMGWELRRITEKGDLFDHLGHNDGMTIVVFYETDPNNKYRLCRRMTEAKLKSDLGSHAHAYVTADQYRQGQLDYVLSWFVA